MRPTRLRTLLLTALLTGLVAYAFVRRDYSSIPPLPWTASLSAFLLAAAETYLAPSVRARLAGRPGTRPIMPLLVARIAALAKASSVLGALLLGAWAGAAAYLLSNTELDFARRDTPRAIVGAATALALVAAALRLENVCRVKFPPPDAPPPAEPGP
jgi:hypothetical protein